MTEPIKLPPLPTPDADHYDSGTFAPVWKQGKMDAYAIAAVEADRQARGNAVASAVSSEPDTEREKWLASLFPEDRMFEEIDQMARESYKRHHSSTRGQMLVRSDSWDSHVVWATKRWIEENESLPAAPQPPQIPEPSPLRESMSSNHRSYAEGWNAYRKAMLEAAPDFQLKNDNYL